MTFLTKLDEIEKKQLLPTKITTTLKNFYTSYTEAVNDSKIIKKEIDPLLSKFLDLILNQRHNPFHFEIFHQRITHPVNYYQLGLDLLKPIIKIDESRVLGKEHLDTITSLLKMGENVILFSNHQTEVDPQAISVLLKKTHPHLAEEMIFVAGHRVTTDPLAIPFSMGRNLLCIYSKKYLEHPPEKKQEKLLHNQRAMRKLRDLLSEGGKCIYVAPSGGRDRQTSNGLIKVASFDPQSIEMFWLMSRHAKRPTHYYPLALSTFNLLPPPSEIRIDLGENRKTHCTPIHLAIGDEIEMEVSPSDKVQQRKDRAEKIWNLVCLEYVKIM